MQDDMWGVNLIGLREMAGGVGMQHCLRGERPVAGPHSSETNPACDAHGARRQALAGDVCCG